MDTLVTFFTSTAAFFIYFGISLFIFSRCKAEDRKFLFKWFIIALSIRILWMLFAHFFTLSTTGNWFMAIDEVGYDEYSWNWLQARKQGETFHLLEDAKFQPGYYSITSLIYFIFGHSILAAKLLNCFFSSFILLPVFYIAKIIFNEKTARLAGKLTALFPELIVYSAFLLKDTILTLLCTIIIFLIIYYNHYGRLGLPKILLLFTALIYISLIRFYMIAILGVILILFYIFTKKIPISRKILGLSLIIILVFLVMIFGRGLEFYENIYSGKIFLFGRYAESELSFTPVFGGAVGLISFVLEKPIIFIKTVLLGSIYAWAGPISWHTLCSPKWFGYIVHALKANYFAVLVWYVFAPFAFWGLYYLIKYRRKLFSSATLISSYLIIYPLIIAVKEKGGLRHRLPIIPFVLICVALAMIRYKKYRFPLFILGIFLMLAFLILDFFIHIPSITS